MTTPSRHARRCAAGAVLAAACLASPAQADSLSPARAVTPPGTSIDGFDLAASPAGGRVALLYGANAGGSGGGQRLLFARLGEGRNLGPVRRLEDRRSASGARRVTTFGGHVAVSADGSAVAAWVARDREAGRDQLRVAIAPRGRGFGPARTLLRVRGRSGYVPYIAVGGVVAGARGRAVVAWSSGQPGKAVMQVAVRTRGRGFGAPQTLGAVGPATATPPAIVLAPSGAVMAAWTRRDDDTTVARSATLRRSDRRFGATRQISGPDQAGAVSAFTGPGGAAVVWSDDRRAAGTLIRLRIARLRRDGTLTAPQTIATVDRGIQAHEVDGLQIGFPLAGPVAAWQVFDDISEAGDGRKNQTHVDSAVSRDGAFAPQQTRSTPGVLTGLPVAGALADRTLVAWPEFTDGAWHLRLAVRPSDGDWGPTRTFADSDGTIAIAASRSSAIVVWQPFAPFVEQRVLQLAVYRP
jgi:hypothetical protein